MAGEAPKTRALRKKGRIDRAFDITSTHKSVVWPLERANNTAVAASLASVHRTKGRALS